MSLKERWVILYVLLLPVLILPQTGLAETVVLKSGKKIVGKILGRTEDRSALIMEIHGKQIPYRFTDIDYIKEERESPGATILPMYGGMRQTQADQETDQEFIEAATKEAGSKEAASQKHVEFGWQYFDAGDLKTAMKRFNQAWLLNPDNADVFLGFGNVSLVKRDPNEAIEMFKKALELNPRYAIAMCCLASAYQLKAYNFRWLLKKESSSYLEQSDQLCEQGSQIDPREEFCYSTWAITLFLQKRYAEAWEKVSKARALGGKTLNADILKDLSAAMPEPRDTER